MIELHKTIAVDATPQSAWNVLGDLAATTEWLPGTVAARMEGTTRICTTADGAEIREEISDYAPDERRYSYRHLEIPLPMQRSSGTFSVEPGEGGGARVVLDCRFEALDAAQEGEIGRMYEGALEQALQSLKRRVEQGRRWDEQTA
jgi:hypothetical protein